MPASLPSRLRRFGLLSALGLAVTMPLATAPAMAQQDPTYGTDQRSCNRSALEGVFSTSRNNLLGSAAGAAVGGLLGSQFGKGGGNTIMTIGGILAGALAGGAIGRSMDPVDQACIGRTLEHTPTNQTVAWENPDNNSKYWVTPTRTYERDGTNCRDYTTTAVVEGRRQEATGTACRQPDGSWKMASDQAGAADTYSGRNAAYDRRGSGSSAGDRDRASDFRQMSDRDLRDQLYRLDDEERQIRRDRQAVEDELDRRGIRR